MPYPIPTYPLVTTQIAGRGYIHRYFVRFISDRNIIEIDEEQYKIFEKDPYYESVKLLWFITGNVETQLINGVPYKGVRDKNLEIIRMYNQKLPGLENILRDPLELYVRTS